MGERLASIPVSELVELERNIARRKETDRVMSFPKWILLAIISLGIAGSLADYRLITRRNEHLKRQRRCEESTLNILQSKNIRVDIASELAKMSSIRKDGNEEEEEKSAILWVILALIPFASIVSNLYVAYFLTRDVYRHHVRQKEFVDEFVNAANRLGIDTSVLDNAIKAQYQVPKRGFGKYILLSIVTFGIFAFYWYYVIFKDWNNHFKTQWGLEDEILSVIKRIPSQN